MENKTRGTMTDTLVPDIHIDELEKTAEAIVAEVYPEALKAPMNINVSIFAERLGLKVKEVHLSRNGTIIGEMIFHKCMSEYYDFNLQRYSPFEVAGGTILVDPKTHFMRIIGNLNSTVIHECIHWIKHRKAIQLHRMNDNNIGRMICQAAEVAKNEQKWNDVDHMEWQANSLVPRVLMPRRPFRQKAEELIKESKESKSTDNINDVIDDVICKLSDFFCVSVQSAKIRMLDIGYEEAINAFECAGEYSIPDKTDNMSSSDENQAFHVPVADSHEEYAANTDFNQLINSGNFVYLDAHYCINDPKYVTQNEYGVLQMTEYAVNHMDECCLEFDRITRPNEDYGVERYAKNAKYQSAVSKTVTEYKYSHTDHNKDVEARAALIRAKKNCFKEEANILESMPGSFSGSLVKLMKWRDMTNEELAEKALLSAKTIQRMRNDRKCRWQLESVMAICVGLRLPPYISDPLIERAGLKIKVGEKGIIYSHLLATLFESPIFEFNEYLEALGYPPLSGRE